ncbi:MAG: hypothetical protein ABI868_08510 [Acidobacteriota bacterium]
MQTLKIVVDTLAQQPPQLYAQYERILACALASDEAGLDNSATPEGRLGRPREGADSNKPGRRYDLGRRLAPERAGQPYQLI